MISIIIPVYNCELYLPRLLSSLNLQTSKQFNVIFVNDGSTDNTKTILEIACKENNNFKLINKSNGGPSSAKNLGIDSVDTEWVTFIDSDDWVNDDYILSFENGILLHPDFDIFYANVQYRYGVDLEQDKSWNKNTNPYRVTQSLPLGTFRTVFRKSILDKYNIRFLPISHFEGESFNLTYLGHMKNKNVLTCYDSVYFHVLQRENSLCNQGNEAFMKRMKVSLPYLKDFIDYCNNNKFDEEIIKIAENNYNKTKSHFPLD